MKTYRAGIIVPWMNTTLEDELSASLPSAVGVHWARMTPTAWPSDAHDESYLPSMMADVPRALRSFTGIPIDEVIVACTSLAFAPGSADALAQKVAARQCVCVRDTIVESWSDGGRRPATLFGPYGPSVLAGAVASFTQEGVAVARAVAIPYDGEIKDIEQEAVVELILKADLPARSTVIISCTALYTLDVPSQLQSRGREDLHFVSSNQSIAQHLVRNSVRVGDAEQ